MRTKNIALVGILLLLLVVAIFALVLTRSNNNLVFFVENYIHPVKSELNKQLTYPLPNIEGLENAGDMIVQGEHEKTFSTNIMTKYVSEALDVHVVEVYKNTQNKDTGNFIRLVGSTCFVKNGYPPLSIDSPILNVDFRTGDPTDIYSAMAFHVPLATKTQRFDFFECLKGKALNEGVELKEGPTAGRLPDFWGNILRGRWDGVDLSMMQKLRDHAWSCYKEITEQTDAVIPFDYKPAQDLLVFQQAESEHHTFAKFGLSVPVEVQGAFFRAMFPAPIE
jgi:hypothetical protein